MTKVLTPAERSIARIRDEMAKRKLTQRDIAKRMGCSQGKVAKLMLGHLNLRVNDLAVLAEAVGLHVSEAIRDRGQEFFAEMSPFEVRILEEFRQWPPHVQISVLTLIGIIPAPRQTDPRPSRAVVSTRKKTGRPLNSRRLRE